MLRRLDFWLFTLMLTTLIQSAFFGSKARAEQHAEIDILPRSPNIHIQDEPSPPHEAWCVRRRALEPGEEEFHGYEFFVINLPGEEWISACNAGLVESLLYNCQEAGKKVKFDDHLYGAKILNGACSITFHMEMSEFAMTPKTPEGDPARCAVDPLKKCFPEELKKPSICVRF